MMTVVIGFAAVAMHATLAQDQLVLDTNRVKVQQAERVNQHLRVEVAELESPERIETGEALRGRNGSGHPWRMHGERMAANPESPPALYALDRAPRLGLP